MLPTFQANRLDSQNKGHHINNKRAQLVVRFPAALLCDVALHLRLKTATEARSSWRGHVETALMVAAQACYSEALLAPSWRYVNMPHLPGVLLAEAGLDVEHHAGEPQDEACGQNGLDHSRHG